MKIREQYTCPLEITHDLMKGKWKPIILWQLHKYKKIGFLQLKKEIKGVSEKMLFEQLNELIQYDIIHKDTFEGYPLSVEYYLSERGEKLYEAISIMQEVGSDILKP